jgi:multidrug efflux system membrane fusion protein
MRLPRFIFLLSAACTLALAGCKKPPAPMQMPPRPVTVAKAILATSPRYIESIGSCVSPESVDVRPQVSGQLLKIHFKQGDFVKKGQVLFTIDERPYAAQLEAAKAALVRDQAQLKVNEDQLRRSKELAPGNYISPQQLDQLSANVDLSKGSVQGDLANIESARINLDYCTIESPISGVTGSYQIDAGNVVFSTDPRVLVSIQAVDPLWVQFTVTEIQLGQVMPLMQKGTLKVRVFPRDNDPAYKEAEVFFIDNAVDTKTGTINLRGTLPNAERLFWPGRFVRVQLVLEEVPRTVIVPASAVQLGQDGHFVIGVGPDNTAEIHLVKPGQRQGQDIAVLEGLKGDETVVVTGQLFIAPGMKLAPQPMDGAAADGKKPEEKAPAPEAKAEPKS